MEGHFVYALKERIGNPDLFVGRKRELKNHLDWVGNIERELSKSLAILARRKSGKTALMQRLYNIIWNKNGKVVPFYIEMEDRPKWLKDFCWEYYCSFLYQYYAFKLQDPALIRASIDLDTIKEIASKREDRIILANIKEFELIDGKGQLDNFFRHVISAPHEIARWSGDFFIIMIDEFQYMNEYIFWDEAKRSQAEGVVGGYHGLSESKIAPMCVSGSYVGWLRQLIFDYFKGGRLRERVLNPRLTTEEGLECVYRYSEITGLLVTKESAIVINGLTKSDPFYISCIFDSAHAEKDLRTAEGVVEAFEFEIRDRGSDLNKVWLEYISNTLSKVNERYARRIVLFLSKNREKDWSRKEIREHLNLEMSEGELERKLKMLVKGDLIGEGSTGFRYQGLQDDLFDLIFRSIYQEEIDSFTPDIKTELMEEVAVLETTIKELRGKLGYIAGHLPEYLLSRELKGKKKARSLELSVNNYQEGVVFEDYQGVYVNYKLNIEDAREHEIDVFAYYPEGMSLAFELKNQKGQKVNSQVVHEFSQKMELMEEHLPEKISSLYGILLSRSGFTAEAETLMEEKGLMYADFWKWFGDSYEAGLEL